MDAPVTLHPLRVQARRNATLAIGLLVAGAFLLRLAPASTSLQATVVPWALFVLLLYAAGSCLWWAAVAWRHHRPDPWAYDPELDGPIAQAMEGRSYLRGTDPPASMARSPVLLLLALALFLAGIWLVGLAGRAWSTGNGAEGPTLTALALFLAAAVFLVASPFLAWAGLRRAR